MNPIVRAGRARRRAGAAAFIAALLSSVSCSDSHTLGPIAPGHARLAIAPQFAETDGGAPRVTLSRIDADLISPSNDSTFATSPFAGDTASIRFDVRLKQSPETFILDLTAFDLEGVEAYHARREYVVVEGDNAGLEPPVLVYSAPDADVTALHLNTSGVTLDLGATTTLSATGTAGERTISPVRVGWTSRDTEVAEVSETGLVQAGMRPGSTYIVARAVNGVADSALVTVRQVPVSLTISAGRTTLPAGLSTQATAHVLDARQNEIPSPVVTWSSSNTAVATVSPTGLVTAVNVGNATITATSETITGSIQITVTGGVTGRVVDGMTGAPIAGATVTGPNNTTVTTAADGTFLLSGVTPHGTITISASGYVATEYFDVATPSTAVGVIPLVPPGESVGHFSGRVTDAVTGASVAGAVLTARAGVNATGSEPILQVTTNSDGAYSADLSAGTYTITGAATGYITTSTTIAVPGDQTLTDINFTATPAGSGNTIRIVLTWGADPSDLDSHLWIPHGEDSLEVAYYADTVRDENGVVLGTLDQDQTSGFGPETITIPNQGAGTYHYFVHHYSGSSTISLSGAVVKVYRGATQIAQIAAPGGACGAGDVWTVFDLNGSTLSTINEIACGSASTENRQPSAAAVRRAIAKHPKAGTPTRVRRP